MCLVFTGNNPSSQSTVHSQVWTRYQTTNSGRKTTDIFCYLRLEIRQATASTTQELIEFLPSTDNNPPFVY